MLRKIYGTNFFHIKLLGHNSIKCQSGPVLPPPQVFYFNGQALLIFFLIFLVIEVTQLLYDKEVVMLTVKP
jgi:hypothetical protein